MAPTARNARPCRRRSGHPILPLVIHGCLGLSRDGVSHPVCQAYGLFFGPLAFGPLVDLVPLVVGGCLRISGKEMDMQVGDAVTDGG